VGLNYFLSLLLLAQTDPSFQVDLNLIRVEVQVTEKERPVMGLRQEQFTVFDNGVAQPIVTLMAEEQPLDLVLLVDLSGSMIRMLEELRRNVAGALKQLRPVDQIGIVSFATESKVELELTGDHARAVAVAGTLAPVKAGTEINRNVELAALYLEKQARVGAKRVVLILTDNLGERMVADRDVVERLWETNVVMHGLLFTPPMLVNSGYRHVEVFSDLTGGEVTYVGSKELDLVGAFERMRMSYALLYRAPDVETSQVRRIDVKVNGKGKYQVRHRRGYRSK
jgi:Ca-activated chloride channel homolog